MIFNGVGVLVDRKAGARAAAATGLLLVGAGFGALAAIGPGDGYGHLVVALVVLGMGSGIAGPAAYGTLLAALPQDRAGVGSAVNDTVQQVGQALSVAVLGTVLTTTYSVAMPESAPGVARRSIGDALGAAAATGDAGLADTARTAFVHAMSTTSLVGVVGGIAAAVLAAVVLRPEPKPSAGEPAPAEAATASGRSTP